nr:hypothetical protein [Lentisphaeria bacterium]
MFQLIALKKSGMNLNGFIDILGAYSIFKFLYVFERWVGLAEFEFLKSCFLVIINLLQKQNKESADEESIFGFVVDGPADAGPHVRSG